MKLHSKILFVLVVALLAFAWSGCASMQAGLDRVTAPLTENGFRAILALGVGFLLWVFIPAGEIARVLVALFGVYIVQEATTPAATTVHDAPGSMIPWYLDPSAWIRPVLSWAVVAIVLGLLWPRSRQQTLAALRELLSFPPHPIRAGRRFLAGLGFLHSDPVPSKKTDKAIAAARLPKDTK